MKKVRAVLFEASLVAAAGLLIALVANAISPRGLRLGRNYFPGAGPAPTPLPASTHSTGTTYAADPLAAALKRLEQRGLRAIASNEVVTLFRDPRREQGLVAFVDARADAPYQAGHIPGAWQFDHYRADAFLPVVLPACLNAQQIVIYCNGGSCEDSEFAAITLRDTGVPVGSLLVYVGGMAEWKAAGMPLETGVRGSGQLLDAKP